MTTSPSTSKNQHRRLQGVVVSTAMQKTAVVRVDRQIPHPKYGKYYTVSRKFHVDNPAGAAHTGDVILFEECRPMSRTKRWRYVETVKAAATASVSPAA